MPIAVKAKLCSHLDLLYMSWVLGRQTICIKGYIITGRHVSLSKVLLLTVRYGVHTSLTPSVSISSAVYAQQTHVPNTEIQIMLCATCMKGLPAGDVAQQLWHTAVTYICCTIQYGPQIYQKIQTVISLLDST